MIESFKQSALYQYAIAQNGGLKYHAAGGAIWGLLSSLIFSPGEVMLLCFTGAGAFEIVQYLKDGVSSYWVDDPSKLRGHTNQKRWFLDTVADIGVAVLCCAGSLLVATYIAENAARLLWTP